MHDKASVQKHICICICTYKRPRLLEHLLEELQRQNTADLFSYSIIVVDNDVAESASAVVEACKQQSSIDIGYFVEPEQNISLARNKAVRNARGDFIALIDDDEYPAQNWLLNFYKTLIDLGADGVLGPVLPYYPEGIPKWIMKSKIWEMPCRKTGTTLGWGETRTSSVLLKRDVFQGNDTPFDPQFGLTGGEDQDFFKRMMKLGRRFVWCNEAPVYEIVPPERWKRSFYLKKYLQQGGRVGELARKWPYPLKCKGFVKATLAVGFYILVLPIACFGGQPVVMKCLLKNLFHFGWLVGFLWRPLIKIRY